MLIIFRVLFLFLFLSFQTEHKAVNSLFFISLRQMKLCL